MASRSRRPYAKDDVFKMKWLHSADLSPDGNSAVYSLTEYDAESDSDYSNLWLRETEGEARKLTSGKGNNTNPSWSPDGRTIAFLSDRVDGKAQVFLLSAEFGEAKQLTTLPQGVGAPVWAPDGSRLAFTAGKSVDTPYDPKMPYRLTRNVYRFDGVGYVHRAINDVYCCDLASGDCKQLTDNDAVNGALSWSPDGTRILFSQMLRPDIFASVHPNLLVVDMDGNEQVVVSAETFGRAIGAWHPDNQHIIFAATPIEKPIGSKSDLYVINLNGTGLENRTPSLPMGVCGGLSGDMPAKINRTPLKIVPTSDGKAAYLEVQRGGTVEIARVALAESESVEPILAGNRKHKLLSLSRDERRIFYIASDVNNPVDLYTSDIEGEDERRLTNCNSDLIDQLAQSQVHRLTYPSIDGVEVESWLIAPDRGTAPYPTILYIHGGPHGAYGHQYRFDTQMLNGAGYAVLLVNHRASIGYDDAFSTAIKGDWGNLDYQDLMHGVDTAIANGLADPARLGVCGLSGGGNLSCWIVGQTDRFKAAVPENPVTNWNSFYGVSDIGVWFSVEELGGHPHEIPEIYTKCSPITYAYKCTTPTLLVQGEDDYRCPAEQSEQFYTVLKANGCPVEMLRLPASSHGGSIDGAPAVRRAQNDALLDWMNQWVLG